MSHGGSGEGGGREGIGRKFASGKPSFHLTRAMPCQSTWKDIRSLDFPLVLLITNLYGRSHRSYDVPFFKDGIYLVGTLVGRYLDLGKTAGQGLNQERRGSSLVSSDPIRDCNERDKLQFGNGYPLSYQFSAVRTLPIIKNHCTQTTRWRTFVTD